MKLSEKLSDVQSRLDAPKNQYNSFGKYKYRSCEDILEGVKPLLSEHKLVLTLEDDIKIVGERIYVKATATVSDGEDSFKTSAFAREALAKKGMDESQITGSASSYARKYALNGLFCVDDTKDADAQKPAPAQKQAPPKPQPKKVDNTPITPKQIAAVQTYYSLEGYGPDDRTKRIEHLNAWIKSKNPNHNGVNSVKEMTKKMAEIFLNEHKG